MLELLFQGFIEWIYGLILECWEYFASVLFDLMSLDFAYLREHMPVIDTIRQIMLGVGWALLIGNLVFQATRGMAAGLGFDAEDPKLLFTRTFAFSFLLVASPQICELGLNMTSTVIELLQMPDAVDVTFADEASFGGLTGSWLLVVICGIIVIAPGKPRPSGSPVMAGFRPMRARMLSAFFATLTMVTTSTIHGSTSRPLG